MNISLSPNGKLELSDSTYSFQVPATEAGVRFIVEVLRARQWGQTKLGQPGAPTQSMIEEMLRAPMKYSIDISEVDI